MPNDETELDALRRAFDHDWPEIQKHLIEDAAKERNYQVDDKGRKYYINERGQKVLVMSLDSWWLDRFDRKDVLATLPGIAIMNTADWHATSACFAFRDAYGVRPGDDCSDCFTADDILAQSKRFPEGQFVAIRISGPGAGHAVGMAVTMRTSRPPSAPVLPWLDAIGDLRISAHEPEGDWLYGVEMAVRPMYQGHGIGTGLYQARFDLARRLNLRGWYAVGMLMGYSQQAGEMSVGAYGEKVIAREVKDPTVTMQMNRGFRAERVITDYVDEPAAGNAGVLIVWDNPDYKRNG